MEKISLKVKCITLNLLQIQDRWLTAHLLVLLRRCGIDLESPSHKHKFDAAGICVSLIANSSTLKYLVILTLGPFNYCFSASMSVICHLVHFFCSMHWKYHLHVLQIHWMATQHKHFHPRQLTDVLVILSWLLCACHFCIPNTRILKQAHYSEHSGGKRKRINYIPRLLENCNIPNNSWVPLVCDCLKCTLLKMCIWYWTLGRWLACGLIAQL